LIPRATQAGMQQPAMTPPFSPAAAGQHATPISSRPPPESQQHQVDEVGGGSASAGSSFVVHHDGGGDDGDRNGPSGGNRWPRQETLALLKIRSEMDAAFREAALKGPLWEQVARCVVMRVQLPKPKPAARILHGLTRRCMKSRCRIRSFQLKFGQFRCDGRGSLQQLVASSSASIVWRRSWHRRRRPRPRRTQ
jgi:hypothetical protein